MSLITGGLDPSYSSLLSRGLNTYIIEVVIPPIPDPIPETKYQVGGNAGIGFLGSELKRKKNILLRIKHESESIWQEEEIESEDKLFDDFWIKFIVISSEESKKINVYIKERIIESNHFSFRVGDILEDRI